VCAVRLIAKNLQNNFALRSYAMPAFAQALVNWL